MARVTVEYKVTNRGALGEALNPLVGQAANDIASQAGGGSPSGPTGRLRGGWQVVGPVRGGALVKNDTDYGRYQEYGTRHVRAQAMMGRAVARARARYGAR